MNHIASARLARYPSDDVRYVPTFDEQAERVKRVTLDQVRSAPITTIWSAGHGELRDRRRLRGLPPRSCRSWPRHSRGWRSEKPYRRIDRPYQPGLKPQRETVTTPDKANAVFLAGLSLPIKDDHPDYPALLAGNYILGGGALSSRIADRLRQKGGLSYTAMSMFAASPLEQRADLMILAIYNPANVDTVVTGVEV